MVNWQKFVSLAWYDGFIEFLLHRGITAWLEADGLNDEPWDFGHTESESEA